MLGTDVLIGMDVINNGDFAVSNHGGVTKFSFRLPSQGHIDFVLDGPQRPQFQFQRGGQSGIGGTRPPTPRPNSNKKRKK